jgi:hypothetical protein
MNIWRLSRICSQKNNLEFIRYFTQSSRDKGFKILLNNPEKADAILGAGFAESIVQRIIINEEVFAKYNMQNQIGMP